MKKEKQDESLSGKIWYEKNLAPIQSLGFDFIEVEDVKEAVRKLMSPSNTITGSKPKMFLLSKREIKEIFGEKLI